jgi:hypothetical protein
VINIVAELAETQSFVRKSVPADEGQKIVGVGAKKGKLKEEEQQY